MHFVHKIFHVCVLIVRCWPNNARNQKHLLQFGRYFAKFTVLPGSVLSQIIGNIVQGDYLLVDSSDFTVPHVKDALLPMDLVLQAHDTLLETCLSDPDILLCLLAHIIELSKVLVNLELDLREVLLVDLLIFTDSVLQA